MDAFLFLNRYEYKLCRSMVGMASWDLLICRVDVSFAVDRCALFPCALRKWHLDMIIQAWGYLKRLPCKGILIDTEDPVFTSPEATCDEGYFKDLHPEAIE